MAQTSVSGNWSLQGFMDAHRLKSGPLGLIGFRTLRCGFVNYVTPFGLVRVSKLTSDQTPIASHQSLRHLLADGIAQLEREQVPSAGLAAELLLMHALGRDRAWIYAHPEFELAAARRQQFFDWIAQRASGIPTQHLTGHQEFWGLEFEVTPDVLIPRPETEHLIEVALARIGVEANGGMPQRHEKLRIADIGTGSGCIAVALARELPVAQILATDISAKALEVARRNAARHGVEARVAFIQCNLLDALLDEVRIPGQDSREFDLIVSNPPYIGRHEQASLPREVREHEPDAALFGGEYGTELYAPLIAQAARLLKPGGTLVLELGHLSAEHVLSLLGAPVWTNVSLTKDLAGIARVASAQRDSV